MSQSPPASLSTHRDIPFAVFSQLRTLVLSVTAATLPAVLTEVRDLVVLLGDDARFFALCALVEASTTSHTHTHTLLTAIATDLLSSFVERPIFAAAVAKSLAHCSREGDSLQSVTKLFSQFSQVVPLSPQWRVVVSLHLSVSDSSSIRHFAAELLAQSYQSLTQQSLSLSQSSHTELPSVLTESSLSLLLSSLRSFAPLQTRSLLFALRLSVPSLCNTPHISALLQSISQSLSIPLTDAMTDDYDRPSSSVTHALFESLTVEEREDTLMTTSIHRVSALVRDLGATSLTSVAAFVDILKKFSALSVSDVAAVVIVMVRTQGRQSVVDSTPPPSLSSILAMTHDSHELVSGGGGGWSASVLVEAVQSLGLSFQWSSVFALLDHPSFLLPSYSAYQLLVEIWRRSTNNKEAFPLYLFLSPQWQHERGRLTVLKWLCPVSVNLLTMYEAPKKLPVTDTDTTDTNPLTHPSSLYNQSAVRHSWWSMDLIQSMSDVGFHQAAAQLQSVIHRAKSLTELTEIGLLVNDSKCDSVIAPVLITVYPDMPISADYHQPLMSCVVSLLLHHPAFIDLILSSAQSLNRSVRLMLTATDAQYTKDLLYLCIRHNETKMQQVLNVQAQRFGLSFIDTCARYLASQSQSPMTAMVSVPHVANLFRLCYSCHSSLSPESQSLVDSSFSALIELLPRLPSYVNANDEIEESCVSLLQKYFTHSLSLPSLVAVLQSLKVSTEPKDREIFAACLHTQFREYRYLHSYPKPQLECHALLWGACINQSFCTSYLRGLALKFVLDSLKNASVKLRSWATLALTQCRGRLDEWPQYCALLVETPHLQSNEPELVSALTSIVTDKQSSAVPLDLTSVRMNIQQELVPVMRTGWHGMKIAVDANDSAAMVQVGGSDILLLREEPSWLIGNLIDSDDTSVGTQSTASTAAARAHQSHSAMLDRHTTYSGRSDIGGLIGGDVSSYGTQSGLNDTGVPAVSHSVLSSLMAANPTDSGSPSLSPHPDNEPHSPPPVSATPPPGLFHPRAVAQAPTTPAGHNTAPVADGTPGATAGGGGNTTNTPSRVGSAGAGFASTHNIDSLLTASHGPALAPVESIKDKIHFIINNASSANIRSKARELRALLRPENYVWFARWFTIHRVSTEQNYQKIYLQLIDGMESMPLLQAMIEAAYENIHVLLASDKVLTSSAERSLLKNLGSWLGLLTIAKNTPIRAKHLDLKQLILDGHDSGRLIAVIPFCAKVLESCHESKVFKPPNPWLMACAGLLKEIFDLPGLKLNLKFEIEVLFRTLDIAMKDVKATALLRERGATSDFRPGQGTQARAQAGVNGSVSNGTLDRGLTGTALGRRPVSPSALSSMLNVDESDVDLTAAGGAGLLGINDALPGIPRSATPSGQTQSVNLGLASDPSLIIPNLPQYVVISPSLPFFSMFPALKRCVPSAISAAIREIIAPVVERSVTIACVTTRELILKDFAMESDEVKMRQAAHSMVQNLTASLALVTCKEPLRVSINNNLGTLLEANTASLPQASDPSVKSAIEQACLQVSNDNLDLGCTIIEKSAAERAQREIDEALTSAYAIRRKAREAGQPYVDMSIFANGRFPASLPEPLRAKSNGLTQHQLRVYDDFTRMRQHYAALVAQPPVTSERGTAATAQPGVQRAAVKDPATGLSVGPPQLQANPLAMGEAELKRRLVTGRSSPPPMLGALSRGSSGVGGPGVVAGRSPPLSAQSQPFIAPTPAANAAQSMLPPSSLTSQQILDKLVTCLAQLESAVLRFPNHKSMPLSLTTGPSNGASGMTGIPADHEIMQSLKLIQSLLQFNPREHPDSRDQISLTFAHKVFKRLYDRENRTSLLQIDVHTQVLKYIRQVCPKLVMELTAWLLLGDDDRKFIIPITVSLIRHRLVNTAEFDAYLTKTLLSLQQSGQILQTVPNPALNQPQPVGSLPPQPTMQTVHPSLEYAMSMVKRLVVKRNILPAMELKNTLEALNALAHASRHKMLQDTIAGLLEDVRHAAINAEREQERAGVMTGIAGQDPIKLMYEAAVHGMSPTLPINQFGSMDMPDDVDGALEFDDLSDPNYRSLVLSVMDEWMQICLQNTHSDKTYAAYLALLHQHRLLATPELTAKFFRTLVTLCVDNALTSISNEAQATNNGANAVQPYSAIDSLIKLFIFLVKFFDAPPISNPLLSVNPNANKIKLLASFLQAIHAVLRKDYYNHKNSFNQRPYLRLLNNLLHDLNNPDPMFDSNNSDVLYHFTALFYQLNPNRIPSFVFAWLELVSHRMFMPKLLIQKNNPNSAALFAKLFLELVKFQQPFLRQAELTEAIKLIYKGTLRILLVLLHDFPEFLCEFHQHLCDVIPTTCIQMRNLILSAFPRSMRLPDPFTPNLKVDLLPEIALTPRLSADVTLPLTLYRTNLLLPLELFLKNRENRDGNFLQSLPTLMTVSAVQTMTGQGSDKDVMNAVRKAGTVYNVPLLNATVLYIGLASLANASANNKSVLSDLDDSAALTLFSTLMMGFDSEGRYHLINALANQLRYPNAHTHYFSMILLTLFLHSPHEVIREQITRVLIERLIVHRPHPWGLLITFMELMKNPRYQFWDQPFTSSNAEMERLFESVAQSWAPKQDKAPASSQ